MIAPSAALHNDDVRNRDGYRTVRKAVGPGEGISRSIMKLSAVVNATPAAGPAGLSETALDAPQRMSFPGTPRAITKRRSRIGWNCSAISSSPCVSTCCSQLRNSRHSTAPPAVQPAPGRALGAGRERAPGVRAGALPAARAVWRLRRLEASAPQTRQRNIVTTRCEFGAQTN